VAAAVGALALWRAARTPAGFALGVSALFLAFFVLNKQAFANYYFFVIGALCVAVAAADPVEADAPARRPWRRGQRAQGAGDVSAARSAP
jgi:4-amino-4-deoxy-L-arabinose transferase-like glycosyltransferase